MFDNTQDFVEKFQLNKNPLFYDVVHLRDRKVGFSIKRKYPTEINFKPSIKRNGEPNDVAVIWVTYLHSSELKRGQWNQEKVPISIRIACVDLYISEHLDYDFEDDKNTDQESPTKESIEKRNSSPKPISLVENNEFFYNHINNFIVDSEGKKVEGTEVLEKLFEQHCDTVHPLKGMPLKAKLSTQDVAIDFCRKFITSLKWLLKNIFGRTIEEDDDLSDLFGSYETSILKKVTTDNLEIFGYKAPKGIIIIFCLFIVVSSIYSIRSEESYLSNLADKELLVLAHSIFIIWLLDSPIPRLLFKMIKLIRKLEIWILGLKFKV